MGEIEIGKHCIVGLDYEEACEDRECRYLDLCRRLFYEREGYHTHKEEERI